MPSGRPREKRADAGTAAVRETVTAVSDGVPSGLIRGSRNPCTVAATVNAACAAEVLLHIRHIWRGRRLRRVWVVHFLNSLCTLTWMHLSGSEDLILACFALPIVFFGISICRRCDGLSLTKQFVNHANLHCFVLAKVSIVPKVQTLLKRMPRQSRNYAISRFLGT